MSQLIKINWWEKGGMEKQLLNHTAIHHTKKEVKSTTLKIQVKGFLGLVGNFSLGQEKIFPGFPNFSNNK